MKQFFALLLGLTLMSPALAQEPVVTGTATNTISWINATQYEDGTALDPADIDSVLLYYGPTSRVGRSCVDTPASPTDTSCYPLITEVTADGATSTGITLTLDQTTTFFFAGVTNVNGVLSRYSTEAPITFELVIEGKKPGPPTGVVVTADITCVPVDSTITCRFVVR